MEFPDRLGSSEFVNSLLNDKDYKEGAFSKIARSLGLTNEDATKQIQRNPLHFSPRERRSSMLAEGHIRRLQRGARPKEAIIGKTRRL